MTGLEIALFILGVAFIIISFFIVDNGTSGNGSGTSASGVTSEAIRRIGADAIEDMNRKTDLLIAQSEDKLENISNDKIIAVGEYSDQVLEKINSNHKEVVFLYQMLNEKEEELKATATKLDNVRIECEKLIQSEVALEVHRSNESMSERMENERGKVEEEFNFSSYHGSTYSDMALQNANSPEAALKNLVRRSEGSDEEFNFSDISDAEVTDTDVSGTGSYENTDRGSDADTIETINEEQFDESMAVIDEAMLDAPVSEETATGVADSSQASERSGTAGRTGITDRSQVASETAEGSSAGARSGDAASRAVEKSDSDERSASVGRSGAEKTAIERYTATGAAKAGSSDSTADGINNPVKKVINKTYNTNTNAAGSATTGNAASAGLKTAEPDGNNSAAGARTANSNNSAAGARTANSNTSAAGARTANSNTFAAGARTTNSNNSAADTRTVAGNTSVPQDRTDNGKSTADPNKDNTTAGNSAVVRTENGTSKAVGKKITDEDRRRALESANSRRAAAQVKRQAVQTEKGAQASNPNRQVNGAANGASRQTVKTPVTKTVNGAASQAAKVPSDKMSNGSGSQPVKRTASGTNDKAAQETTTVRRKQAQPSNNPAIEAEGRDNSSLRRNEEIIALHRQGRSVMEISKLLRMGQGEVRLIINLYG